MRFGRRSRDEQAGDDPAHSTRPATTGFPLEAPTRGTGPFDAAEVEDLDDWEGIDLGSLLVLPAGPMEMRLQVDEDSGEVIAAVLVDEQGALELRAFAASRGGGSWDELRPADLGRDGADGWHRDRGGGHLRHRAGLRGADAGPRGGAGACR